MKPKPKSGSPFENDPLFLEVLAEGLAIQERFSAEPVYSKTGKGYLKSVGVAEIQALKAERKKDTKQASR
jgi:hypothetical protein